MFSMIGIILLVFLGVAVFASVGTYASSRNKYKETKDLLEKKFDGLAGFYSNYKITDSDFIFAVDETHQQIAVVDKARTRIIPFGQICKVEYVENGKTVSSNSDLKKGIMAGAMAAVTGIAIFSFSNVTKTKKLISSMQIKISLRDNPEPYFYLTLIEYNTKGGFDPSSGTGSVIYKDQLRIANEIFDCFREINNKVYYNSPQENVQQSESNNQSVADELLKLAKLKEKGILTESEFEEQKKKLMNN